MTTTKPIEKSTTAIKATKTTVTNKPVEDLHVGPFIVDATYAAGFKGRGAKQIITKLCNHFKNVYGLDPRDLLWSEFEQASFPALCKAPNEVNTRILTEVIREAFHQGFSFNKNATYHEMVSQYPASVGERLAESLENDAARAYAAFTDDEIVVETEYLEELVRGCRDRINRAASYTA